MGQGEEHFGFRISDLKARSQESESRIQEDSFIPLFHYFLARYLLLLFLVPSIVSKPGPP